MYKDVVKRREATAKWEVTQRLDKNSDRSIYKRKHHSEYRKTETYKLNQKEWRSKNKHRINEGKKHKTNSSFKDFMKEGLFHIRKWDKKKGFNCDIDLEYLLNLLNVQNYRCKLSNILLTHQRNLKSVSIDRIDSTKGHTKDNIQLVCKFINLGKGNKSDSEVLSILSEIREQNIMQR